MKNILLPLALLSFVNMAEAAVDWNLTSSGTDQCISNCSGWQQNSITFEGNDSVATQVDATSYYNTGAGYGGSLVQGDIRRAGDYGVIAHTDGETYSSPYHAIGNGESQNGSRVAGNFESILFDFGENNEVTLNEICITWHKYDSDISIAAYEGSNQMSLAGNEYSDLLGNGWTDVAQLTNLDNYHTYDFNTGDIRSRYWLIGAYNPGLDSAYQNGQRGAFSTGNDFFKLEFIGGDVHDCAPSNPDCGIPGDNSVPVPGTLLLTLVGLLSGLYFRRRIQI